jgi:ribosomal protein S18 acetylase RimI-like enzyme
MELLGSDGTEGQDRLHGMEVRQIGAADWEALRRLRLRALADAPGAFASTLEAELAFGDDIWRQRAGKDPAAATFIASESGDDIGLARIFAEPDPPGRTHLVSMWVDPGHRRRGVARALIDRAIGWATEYQAEEVILWVADQNAAARRLYERAGFRPTGERQPLPSDPAITESRMRLPLTPRPGGGAGPGRGGRRRPGPRSARP